MAFMKVTCPTSSLRETLRLASKGVKKTSPIPALQHVKIETDPEIGIRLTATDYELEIQCATGAKVDAPGTAMLPARQFMEIVSAAAGAEITLEANAQHSVTLKSGRSRWRLAGIAASEFPALPPTGDSVAGIIPQWELKRALGVILHAISKEDTRPSMTGALLRVTGDSLQLVATDTYRLASCEMTQVDRGVSDYQAIIPRRAVQELIPFLSGDAEEEVSFRADESQIEFRTPFYTVKSRLLAGTFPAVDRIIAMTQANSHGLTVPRLPFIEALKRAEILAREDLHRVKWELLDGELSLSVETPMGESREELEIISGWEPRDIALWFRADQLLEALQAFDTEQVTLGYETPLRPLFLFPGDVPYFEILMPVCPPAAAE